MPCVRGRITPIADIAKSGTPSISTVVPCPAHHISGLVAGEAITAGDLVYVKSDGKLWKSIGTAVNAAAKVAGMALQNAAVGEGCSAYFDVNVRYGAGLTPGTPVFLSATAGGGLIADAASTGGTAPVGFVIDATRIRIWQSRY
jgi:hypothetical protein